MRKKLDNQFLIVALVSIVIIGIFIIAPPSSPSGHATSDQKITAWHCGFYSTSYDPKGSWRWVSWPDTETRIEKKITPKDADCVTGDWVCPYDTCGAGKIVEDCYCIE